MSWTGNPSESGGENGRFAAAQAAHVAEQEAQNRRAARVVAGHSTGAADCAEMLAMLGLAAGGRPMAAGRAPEVIPGR